ncbi:MAG: alpha/beta hydrolase [Syntrophomonadaceae bacterium]
MRLKPLLPVMVLSVIIFSLLFSSCISYQIAEKDIFNSKKVSRLNDNLYFEDVYFTTSDSLRLNGWFIRSDEARGTLLFFGGNGYYMMNRTTFDAINMFTDLKMNLFIIDYRGSGRSEGSPTIQGIYEDGLSAYKYLCSRKDLDTSKIIVYGHSLGSFVAMRVGCTYPVAGVILEGGISNSLDMRDAVLKASAPWYLRWLVRLDADSTILGLDNVKQARNLKKPLLVITGEKDNIAPSEFGRKIYDSAASSLKRFEIVPNGEHPDLYFTKTDGRRDYYLKALSKYLDEVFGKEPNAATSER